MLLDLSGYFTFLSWNSIVKAVHTGQGKDEVGVSPKSLLQKVKHGSETSMSSWRMCSNVR